MIKRGDYVRVAEIINPKTNIVESMSGKVGKVKSSNSNGVVVEFNREKLPTQILFFTKELVKINPDFIFGKIKEILSDKKRFVTLKLKDI
nr:hypothetical protein [Candidatus Thorarchaeota archaeon]NIW51667.1 hypothetical protein [Candidatus Korarchaeota archaeon]